MPTASSRLAAPPRPRRRPVLAALAVTVAALAVTAPAASATVWRAAADDPVDAGLAPGRDIVRAALVYDDVAGVASTTIALNGAPTGDRAFALILGRKDGAGACESPALAVVSVVLAGGTGGNWKLVGAGGGEVASGNDVAHQQDGTSVIVTAAAAALAGGVYDCAQVQTLDAPSSGAVLRDTISFAALTADPPPAPPTQPAPAPAPAPPAPSPPAPKKAPALRVTASGLPKAVVRGRRYRVNVRVSNVGTAAAKRLKLTASKASGVRVTPTRATWKRLAAGKSVTRRITVRATTKRVRTVRLRVTGSGKLSATATLRVTPKAVERRPPAKRAPKKKRKAAAKPTPAKAPLAGRYFWGFKTQINQGWDNYAVLFVDDRWVYVGFPKEGIPTCTVAVTEGDGCRRYTLDAKSGALKAGELEGTWKDGASGGLTFDGLRMSELAFAKPGARYTLSLQHKDFSGQCGFITGCTTWSNYFALNAEGKFVSSGSSISSMGGSGTPYVWSGAFPSDENGSYEILSRGRIRLAYLSGKVEVLTLGLELDKSGKPAPETEGLLLGSTNFYD